MDNAMNKLWRAQQDAATRLTESWRDLNRPPADRAPRTPAPPEADDPTSGTRRHRPREHHRQRHAAEGGSGRVEGSAGARRVADRSAGRRFGTGEPAAGA